MEMPQLYRKRFIPDECVHLGKDEIVLLEKDKLITRWNTIKPRKDFSSGVSLYLFSKGYKISRMERADGSFWQYYCDIVHTDYYPSENKYVFVDLLADVIIQPDGCFKVVDLDELSEAYKNRLLSEDLLHESLNALNSLLTDIYSGEFKKIIEILDKY